MFVIIPDTVMYGSVPRPVPAAVITFPALKINKNGSVKDFFFFFIISANNDLAAQDLRSRVLLFHLHVRGGEQVRKFMS